MMSSAATTSAKLKVGIFVFHQIPKFNLAENFFLFVNNLSVFEKEA